MDRHETVVEPGSDLIRVVDASFDPRGQIAAEISNCCGNLWPVYTDCLVTPAELPSPSPSIPEH